MRKSWSEEEDKILARTYPRGDIPREEILKIFPGRTWSGIQNRANSRLGLHRGNECHMNKEQIIRLEKVYKI